jgi:hypothetical protein
MDDAPHRGRRLTAMRSFQKSSVTSVALCRSSFAASRLAGKNMAELFR